MKTTLRAELPLLALLGGMFLLAALTWPSAPERIPVHWGISGEVDRFGGKVEGLLGLPLVALGLYLLLLFLPRIDPGRANYPAFAAAYRAVRFAVLAMLAAIYGLMHLVLRGIPVRMETAAPLLAGALLVVLGGVMGKIRPNWFVGVRTPWTLSSKTAWTKTHRLAGWLFLAAGLVTMAASVLGPRVALPVLLASAVTVSLVSVAYSYFVWRSDPDKVAPAGSLPADEA